MTREQLLPAEVLARLPRISATEHEEDRVAQVKFFYPDWDWTWYVIEFDGDDLCFGLVDGFSWEFGYFLLSELLEERGKFGMEIERDLFFEPTPVKTLLPR